MSTPVRNSTRIKELKDKGLYTPFKLIEKKCSTPKTEFTPRKSLRKQISSNTNLSVLKRKSSEENDEFDEPPDENCLLMRSDYFHDVSTTVKKSDNTLNNLDLGAIKALDWEILKMDPIKETVINYYEEELFPKIYGLLIDNFNVFLGGLGSKKNLLEKFEEKWLSDETYLRIYGFFPELNLKVVISKLCQLFDLTSTDKESFYEKGSVLKNDIYLVIHSIDVLFKTDPKIQSFLIELYVKCRGYLHILASVDHVNAALMFDNKQSKSLRYVCLDATTYESFQFERAYLQQSNKGKKQLFNCIDEQKLAVSRIINLYHGLPPHTQKVLILIFKEWIHHSEFRKLTDQATNVDEEDMKGLTYSAILDKCKQDFLVTSASAFRSRLVELLDHDLIKKQKRSGTEYILVSATEQIIHEFLKEIENVNK